MAQGESWHRTGTAPRAQQGLAGGDREHREGKKHLGSGDREWGQGDSQGMGTGTAQSGAKLLLEQLSANKGGFGFFSQ